MTDGLIKIFVIMLFVYWIIKEIIVAVQIQKLIKRALPRADDDTEKLKISLYSTYKTLYDAIMKLLGKVEGKISDSKDIPPDPEKEKSGDNKGVETY